MKFNRKKMKSKRKKLGFTLQQLADATSSCKSYIWELEEKKIEPSGSKLMRLSVALGECPEWFYGLEPLDTTKKVLGTLITWIAQAAGSPLSVSNAGVLLKELNGVENKKTEE